MNSCLELTLNAVYPLDTSAPSVNFAYSYDFEIARQYDIQLGSAQSNHTASQPLGSFLDVQRTESTTYTCEAVEMSHDMDDFAEEIIRYIIE